MQIFFDYLLKCVNLKKNCSLIKYISFLLCHFSEAHLDDDDKWLKTFFQKRESTSSEIRATIMRNGDYLTCHPIPMIFEKKIDKFVSNASQFISIKTLTRQTDKLILCWIKFPLHHFSASNPKKNLCWVNRKFCKICIPPTVIEYLQTFDVN